MRHRIIRRALRRHLYGKHFFLLNRNTIEHNSWIKFLNFKNVCRMSICLMIRCFSRYDMTSKHCTVRLRQTVFRRNLCKKSLILTLKPSHKSLAKELKCRHVLKSVHTWWLVHWMSKKKLRPKSDTCLTGPIYKFYRDVRRYIAGSNVQKLKEHITWNLELAFVWKGYTNGDIQWKSFDRIR